MFHGHIFALDMLLKQYLLPPLPLSPSLFRTLSLPSSLPYESQRAFKSRPMSSFWSAVSIAFRALIRLNISIHMQTNEVRQRFNLCEVNDRLSRML